MAELIVGTNSYITVAEADNIIRDNYLDTDEEYVSWFNLSENNKSVIILRITSAIDSYALHYRGYKVDDNQPMQFPRNIELDDVLTSDTGTIDCPEEIKKAIVMLGIDKYVAGQTEESELRNKGIQTYKIKDASVTFFSDSDKNDIVINGVLSMPRNIWDSCFARYSNICM